MKCKNYSILLAIIVLVFTGLFFTLNILRYNAFYSYEWEDNAGENQIAWNTARGNFFYNSTRAQYFADHISLFYLVIAAGYLIVPHIFTWYLMAVLGAALGGVIIYKLADVVFNNRLKAFLIALLYFLYPPLHYVVLGSIDTITFIIPLFLASFYFYKINRFGYFVVFMVLAMSCKEDVSLMYIFFAGYAFLYTKEKKWAAVSLLLGITWFIIATRIVLPNFMRSGEGFVSELPHRFVNLDKGTFEAVLKFMLFSPLKAIKFMFSNDHLFLLFRFFLPVCFMPLFSLATFIGLPGFLTILLQDCPLVFDDCYYIARYVPFIFIGYIFGLNRMDAVMAKLKVSKAIRDRTGYMIIGLSLCICIATAFGNNMYGYNQAPPFKDKRFEGINNIFHPIFYKQDNGDRIAWSMIKMIPKNASVSASGDLLIPLSHREKIMEVGLGRIGYDYFDADYIIINKKNMYFGAGHYEEIGDDALRSLDSLVKTGKFKILSEQGDFVLFKRITPRT